MQIRKTFQPAEFGIVMADNSRVGIRPLTEIQVTIRSNDRFIGVVVAARWQIVGLEQSWCRHRRSAESVFPAIRRPRRHKRIPC